MMICPKPTRLFFIAVLCLVGGFFAVGKNLQAQPFSVEVVKIKTAKGDFSFKTEIAISPQQRQQGLMFRRSMAGDAAMLFLWRQPQPVSMWMKNTYVSLDMVFIRQNGVVANVAKATVPHSLISVSSDGDVTAVMELVAGTAARIGLNKGDRILYRFFRNH